MSTASDRLKSQIIYTSSVWESAAPYVVWEIATPNTLQYTFHSYKTYNATKLEGNAYSICSAPPSADQVHLIL
jgi:hypothetical protein